MKHTVNILSLLSKLLENFRSEYKEEFICRNAKFIDREITLNSCIKKYKQYTYIISFIDKQGECIDIAQYSVTIDPSDESMTTENKIQAHTEALKEALWKLIEYCDMFVMGELDKSRIQNNV